MAYANRQPGEDYAREVADAIIEQLRKGTAPWMKPWKAGEGRFMPHNPTTGKDYRGINALWLMSQAQARGYADSRWMTFNQARDQGACVRKGEKGTRIQFWRWSGDEPVMDEATGKPKTDERGEVVRQRVQYERPRVFTATVFNAAQIDGLPPPEKRQPLPDWERQERAEHMLKASGAEIRHIPGDVAFYRLAGDYIALPERSQFPSADGYYATALHELAHWTGHETRLAREFLTTFGTEEYAREELRAEIASLMLGDQLGIGHDPSQHIAYVGNWIKKLQEDPREIFRAAADAEKIASYLHSLERDKQQAVEGERQPATAPGFEQGPGDQIELKKVLQTITRASQIRGMEGERVPDPIAQDLLAMPGLNEVEKTLINHGISRLIPLGAGAGSVILDAGKDRVLRLGLGALTPIPRIPEVIQPIASGSHKGIRFEIMPMADTQGISADDVLEMAKRLAEKGYEFSDPGTDNLGRIAGTLVVIDPGAVTQARALDEHAGSKSWTAFDPGPIKSSQDVVETHRISADAPVLMQPEAPMKGEPRTILAVPFVEKDAARKAGAHWDKGAKVWYAPAGTNLAPLQKWLPTPTAEPVKVPERSRAPTYLAVPYKQKEQAKALGARWDKEAGAWYVPANIELAPFAQWVPKNQEARQASPVEEDARQEFGEALRAAGLQIGDSLPMMDGQFHRVPVEGDKKGAKSGVYKGHLDGHPAGYIENFKAGIKTNWKSKTMSRELTEEDRARLTAESAQHRADRNAAREEGYTKAAERARQRWEQGKPIDVSTMPAYLQKKGVPSYSLRTDAHGNVLVPLQDTSGNIVSMQTIAPDGMKSFQKWGKVEGGMFRVNPTPASQSANGILLVAEGYATAATIARATGRPTYAAFIASNLLPVAKELRQLHPKATICIAADNDHLLPLRPKPLQNVGRNKAEAAAVAVGGHVLLPPFRPGAKGSDWNDLEQEVGTPAIRNQLNAAIEAAQILDQARSDVGRGKGAAQQPPDAGQDKAREPVWSWDGR